MEILEIKILKYIRCNNFGADIRILLLVIFIGFIIQIGNAQNFNSIPNSNQPPKVPNLLELNQQQQIQIQHQNRLQMEKSGYHLPPTPQQQVWNYYDQKAISQHQKEQELYKLINSIDKENSTNSIDTEEFNSLFAMADTNSKIYKYYSSYYYDAYYQITDMLSGRKELSLKLAVFLVENAYHQNKLSYTNYCKQIDELVVLCKYILNQNGLKSDNYIANHYAIQKLFSESFTYKNSAGKFVNFTPFSYDYDDYMGEYDHTKMFVTKLLNTRKGQCHSLPLLYLIIAEELNINAYLGLAPNWNVSLNCRPS